MVLWGRFFGVGFVFLSALECVFAVACLCSPKFAVAHSFVGEEKSFRKKLLSSKRRITFDKKNYFRQKQVTVKKIKTASYKETENNRGTTLFYGKNTVPLTKFDENLKRPPTSPAPYKATLLAICYGRIPLKCRPCGLSP